MKKLFPTNSLISVIKVSDYAAVIGVNDVAACRAALLTAGIAAGDIVDWEVVLCCDLHDPDGNRISLAQVIG